MRNNRPDPMPVPFVVFMLVTGILLGSIFTFGMQYWNAQVTKETCTVVKTQILSYEELHHSKPNSHVVEIAIDCDDGNRYYIDGVSVNEDLRQKMSLLSENASVTLLIHPNSNTIVELSSNQGELLSFDETIKKLGTEATGFLFIGLFMYFCALTGLYYIVYHFACRRKI